MLLNHCPVFVDHYMQSGVPTPHDGQEGRFRTASLHPPAAPEITTIYY